MFNLNDDDDFLNVEGPKTWSEAGQALLFMGILFVAIAIPVLTLAYFVG